MSKKKRKIKFNNSDGIIFSTDPDFKYNENQVENETIEPANQQLRIFLDRKQRKGKTVTIVEGFVGTNENLKTLEKKLKTSCGVGGSAKDGIIIIQGDMREKIKTLLNGLGYNTK